MRIKEVNIYKVLLSFTGDYSITKKKWYSVYNIVVEMIADQGRIKGYGEGAPRLFVTGESSERIIRSAINRVSYFLQKDTFPWDLSDAAQIWHFVDSLPKGKENNAAICVLEMALLDILGKAQNKPILDYFPKDFYTDKVYYGATITLGTKQRIEEMTRMTKKIGINHLRVKMSEDIKKNKETIETISIIYGNNYELRLDPNGVWDRELALMHVPIIKEYKVRVVEEPLMSDNPALPEFADIMKSLGVIVMACHSVTTLEDVERIAPEGHYQMVNVKLSRSGGFRRALRMIDSLRTNKLLFQVGCHLGESGILSAGGRALGLLCGDALYYDGSYDEQLLKENVTSENVSFGPGGEACPLDGSGLGVEIDSDRLLRLSNGAPFHTISNPLF
jgi:L-alanine-DL-glutamate epimerase-like enolase superfamily enzyme